jgi:PAS domain S-box-containing protein
MASRILIIDDDAAMLQALSAMVEIRIDHVTVETCTSAADALMRIPHVDYDAIVSDIKMPGMDGLGLMERVLAMRPTTPTLLVTGHGDHDFGVKALKAGAYAFIQKPIDRDYFIAWLKRALQLRQLTRAVEQQNQMLERTVQERTVELERTNRELKETLERERESEYRLRELIDALPAAIYTTDAEGRIMHYNGAAVALWGREPEVGKDLWCGSWRIYEPDGASLPLESCPMAVAIREGRSIRGKEIIIERPDGTRCDVLPYPDPIRDASGAVVGAVNMLVDLTDRKQAERELTNLFARECEARNDAQLLNDVVRTLAAELDVQKLLQKVTDAGTTLTGAKFGAFFYNAVNEQGESYLLYTLSGAPREAFDKFGMPRNTPLFGETFRGTGVVRIDDVLQDPRYGQNPPHRGMPSGHLPVRSYLAVPVLSRSGEVLGGLFFGHPEPGVFTERAERLSTGIAAQAAIAIDNARLYEQANRTAEELRQQIAARERGDKELREHHARYRGLFDAVPVAVFVCDRSAVIQDYNRRAAQFWGREPKCGDPNERYCGSLKLYRPDGTLLPHSQSPIVDVLRTGIHVPNVEVSIERPDGSRIPVIVNFAPLTNAQGEIIGAITSFDDISMLKRAEEALRERARLATLRADISATLAQGEDFRTSLQRCTDFLVRHLDVAFAGIWTLNASEHVLELQASAGPYTHLDGPHSRIIMGEFKIGRIADTRQPLLTNDVTHDPNISDPDWARREGMVAFAGYPLVVEDRAVGVVAMFARHPLPDSVLNELQPLSDGMAQFIERKRAEEEINRLLQEAQRREQALRDKQTQLVQAAKLASIGELSSGIAHELNNPLNNIGLYVANVVDQLRVGDIDHGRVLRNLESTLQQVARAASIINHVRTFARGASSERQPISINHIVRSAVSLVHAQFRLTNVEVSVTLSCEEPMVLGNAIQLEQVFINVLTNARDAVEQAPDKRIAIVGAVRETHIDVMVTDTGSGIPTELQSRIFDPFFTTKEVGRGTGLGLSISYGIIKEHQGEIEVQSEPGKQTTFTIRLPLASKTTEC